MNKKKVLTTACISVALLTVSACSGGTYGYQVSGVVEDGQVDYDCPRNLSMEAVGFVTGKSPRTSSGRSTSGFSGTRKKSGKTDSRSSPARRSATLPKTVSKSPARGGVKLSKKPDKPKRITVIPARKYRSKPHGCKIDDYELFIRSHGGLYEQDVRRIDYDKCLDEKRETFPLCTKN